MTILQFALIFGVFAVFALLHFNRKLNQIQERLSLKAATQQDLDNALSNIEGQITTLGTDLQKTLADLEAKIAASGTNVDFTPEVGRLQAIGTALAQFDTEATAADAAPTPAA